MSKWHNFFKTIYVYFKLIVPCPMGRQKVDDRRWFTLTRIFLPLANTGSMETYFFIFHLLCSDYIPTKKKTTNSRSAIDMVPAKASLGPDAMAFILLCAAINPIAVGLEVLSLQQTHQPAKAAGLVHCLNAYMVLELWMRTNCFTKERGVEMTYVNAVLFSFCTDRAHPK